MRPFLKVLLYVLGTAVVALLAWRTQLSYTSTTFIGPEFHALNAADSSKVNSELLHHLKGLGFKEADSPSEMDSRSGVHREGSKRSWFVREESRKRSTWVEVDLDPMTVRTSVKWESHGTERSRMSAENDAYQFALKLDDWFRAQKEVNRLLVESIEGKRNWFIEALEQNQAR